MGEGIRSCSRASTDHVCSDSEVPSDSPGWVKVFVIPEAYCNMARSDAERVMKRIKDLSIELHTLAKDGPIDAIITRVLPCNPLDKQH